MLRRQGRGAWSSFFILAGDRRCQPAPKKVFNSPGPGPTIRFDNSEDQIAGNSGNPRPELPVSTAITRCSLFEFQQDLR
ncbi:Hypothetical predicted protein [Cloeon dipterum]|uniref:Uncharacterized protein n=1 Tax=Cloeon dipterum TaxID=197152 RepID=A0A8S1CFV2_9INSE|nr:Hypothetical predicted protein [Cloeon dipterum]